MSAPTKRPTSSGAEEILGLYFPVLDHGFVALVDYMGTDECIERAARVSYGYGTRKKSLTRGLVRYLRRHKHTTPSEMVELKFHCCMPMFIARQWIRHRTACLAGDAELVFDLPGAEKRRRRQCHKMRLDDFFRMWTRGTQHPMAKKKPGYLDRIDPARTYTIPELAKLVDRREETLRNYVRDGALDATRSQQVSPTSPCILVAGAAWIAFTTRQHVATVPMRERLARMRLRSCDEATGEIGHTNVVDISESGKKPVFRVTLGDGRSLKMSKDHRCLTEKGWMTLEEATGLRMTNEGRVVWRDDTPRFAVNGTPAHQCRAWLEEQRKAGLSVDDIANRAGVSYHTIRKYLRIHRLQFSAKERSRLSGRAQRGQRRTLRRVFTESHREAIRRARSGRKSNFWKGGISSDRQNIGRWTTEHAARTHARFDYMCALCGSKRKLHAHHLDPVWHNADRARDPANLVSLCRACHDRIHADNLELELLSAAQTGQPWRSFWEGRTPLPRHAQKRLPRVQRLVRSFVPIARIEYVGDEMTYNLEVAGPWHNFVANGFIVHNSVNEYSGRYSLIPMLFYTPPEEQLQTQSRKNNQGRSGETVDAERYKEVVQRFERVRKASREAYEWMTGEDIARELARIDLPLSTYTQWYWKIDLHNLLHFLTLRVDRHAQWEIQEYGKVMAGMLERVAPLSYEAWIDYDVCGAPLSRLEFDALRTLVGAKDGTLTGTGGALDREKLLSLGLSAREVDELMDKLAPRPVPDFTLDPSKAVSAEVFAERFAEAVPKIDRSPKE